MSAIALFRIDERLVHGQVVTAWVGHVRAKKIIVIDDASADDSLLSMVLKMACPPGITMQIIHLSEAENILANEPEEANALVVVKNPVIAKELLSHKLAVLPKEVNMGNAGNAPGRQKLTASFYVDAAGYNALEEISRMGYGIFFQTIPADTRHNWEQVKKPDFK